MAASKHSRLGPSINTKSSKSSNIDTDQDRKLQICIISAMFIRLSVFSVTQARHDIQESLQRVRSPTNNAGLLLIGEFVHWLEHKYVDFTTCHKLRTTC